MSLAEFGNATAVTLAANAITSLVTKQANKPTTKSDLTQLFKKLNACYYLVKDIEANAFGSRYCNSRI